MMKWKILVSAPYMQDVIDRFRPVFASHDMEIVVPPVRERLEESELLRYMGDIDGVICGDDRFTERVLLASPRLKVISKWGTGIDSIDQAACKRLGIAVCNTPNAFSEPVADTVVGYMLCFARGMVESDRQMKAGVWQKIPSRALRECTLGVIGVGNVGKAVARRAAGFGMKVLGCDPVNPSSAFLAETRMEMLGLEALLPRVDFLSLNCDLNPTSFHLLNDNTLSLAKPGAVVINTSRGPVVDEPALVRALQKHAIAGAALDVFELEPLPPESPLRQMNNVLLAPHNANSSPEAWEKVHTNTINNLVKQLQGGGR